MTISNAVTKFTELYEVWVGPYSAERVGINGVSAKRIKDSTRLEREANRQFPKRTTDANRAETHAAAIMLGKVCRALEIET
jgi:deoxyxylulose-5-phosphate synthase